MPDEGKDASDRDDGLPITADGPEDPLVALNETLERLPQPQREIVVEGIMQIESRMHRGPLPSANELAAYERALPGLAREIVDNSKAEQTHRHQMDRRTGTQEFVLNIGGLIATLLALFMMLAIVAYMVSLGHAASGAALGGAIIVGVVVALTNYGKQEATPMPSGGGSPKEVPEE